MAQLTSPDTNQFAAKHTDEHVDRMLDQAIEDSFSTSDPVSLTMPHQRFHEELQQGATRWAAVGTALPLLIIGGIILALLLRRAGD